MSVNIGHSDENPSHVPLVKNGLSQALSNHDITLMRHWDETESGKSWKIIVVSSFNLFQQKKTDVSGVWFKHFSYLLSS